MEESQSTPLTTSDWRVLADREASIRKVRNLWQRECVRRAHPLSDQERNQAIAAQTTFLKKANIIASAMEKMAREIVAEVENGVVIYSELEMVRIGRLRKAFVTGKGESPTQAIDLFDGANVGHFSFTTSKSSLRPDAKLEHFWRGSLSLDKSMAMDRSATPGLDILLMQMPVDETFDASAQWEIHEHGFVLTTRHQQGINWRLTLSKTTGCPLALEKLQAAIDRVLYVHQVTETEIVAGIEVPAEIVSYPASSGSVEQYEFKHNLKSCHFNDDVDESDALLPAGTRISDHRLGLKNAVNYEAIDRRIFTDSHLAGLASSGPTSSL